MPGRFAPKRSIRVASCFWALATASSMILLPAPGKAQQQHLRISVQMLQQGDLQKAECEARLAMADISGRPMAYAILGAIRLQQIRYGESARFLETAVRLNPRLVGAQLNLGNVYALQGKTESATARFREVLKIAPDNFDARFALARIEGETGHNAESTALATPITERLRRSDEGLILMASNALARADESVASSSVKDWVALGHPSSAASLRFAQIFASHELFQQAISILEHDQSRTGDSFELDFILGSYHLKLNHFSQAAANYKLALDARADCSSCLYQLSRISEKENNLDQALSYLLAARQIAPNDADILFEFGRICVRKDLYKDAVESLTAAVQLRPDSASFQYVLASAYTSRKEYQRAIPILEHLLEVNPNDSILNYSLGAVQYLNSDLNDAETHLQRSIETDPKQVTSYYYLGLIKEHIGDTKEAAQIFQSLADRYPDHAPTFLALGEILLGERKYPEARVALERATQLDSSSVKSHYQLGLVLARMGQSEASKKEFALVKNLNTQEEKQIDMRIFSPQD